jgi:hypothetical protein
MEPLTMADALLGRQDPRNQAPGMGSTANALPLANPLADQRQQALSDAERNHLMSMLYSGLAVGAAPFALANPAAAIGSMAGAAGGLVHDRMGDLDGQRARALGYQGN